MNRIQNINIFASRRTASRCLANKNNRRLKSRIYSTNKQAKSIWIKGQKNFSQTMYDAIISFTNTIGKNPRSCNPFSRIRTFLVIKTRFWQWQVPNFLLLQTIELRWINRILQRAAEKENASKHGIFGVKLKWIVARRHFEKEAKWFVQWNLSLVIWEANGE